MSEVYIALILDEKDRVKDYEEDIMLFQSETEAIEGLFHTLIYHKFLDPEDYITRHEDSYNHEGICLCCNDMSYLRGKLIEKWKKRLESVEDLEDLCREISSGKYENAWRIVIEKKEIP